MSSNNFYGINKTSCILYVPTGSKALYQAANQWKDFVNIVEFTTATPMVTNESISIYPNPVTESFSIYGIEGTAKLTVYDLNGRLLMDKNVVNNEAINITSLAKGLYFLKIISDTGIFDKKLIKK